MSLPGELGERWGGALRWWKQKLESNVSVRSVVPLLNAARCPCQSAGREARRRKNLQIGIGPVFLAVTVSAVAGVNAGA